MTYSKETRARMNLFLTRNHLLTQKRFHQNYGLSVIDRTHSFAHEIIIIFVINVMLLLYLLAAVRKVENEFTRALLKS